MTTCNEDNDKNKKNDYLMSVYNLQQLPIPNYSNTEITIITTDNNASDGGINENINNLNMNNEKEHSNVTYHDIIKHIKVRFLMYYT